MKTKPLEKSLNTEQEVVQLIVARYLKAFDNKLAQFQKRLENIKKGKLPNECTNPKSPYYRDKYAEMSVDEKRLEALNDLEDDLDFFRNGNDGTDCSLLIYCGLMKTSEFPKIVTEPLLSRDRIMIKLFGEIHRLRYQLEPETD